MSIFRTASTLALATALALAAGPAFSYSINNSRQIVDDSGKVVQLKGVNVFGFETWQPRDAWPVGTQLEGHDRADAGPGLQRRAPAVLPGHAA